MLILTRRIGQSFIITAGSALDPKISVGELFRQGPIEICVSGVSGSRVRLNIVADRRFLILREELCEEAMAAQPLNSGLGWP